MSNPVGVAGIIVIMDNNNQPVSVLISHERTLYKRAYYFLSIDKNSIKVLNHLPVLHTVNWIFPGA